MTNAYLCHGFIKMREIYVQNTLRKYVKLKELNYERRPAFVSS